MDKSRLLLTAYMGFFAASAHSLTLNEFVTEVVQTNPELLQRVHTYRQVVEDERIASAGWRPSVDLDASVGSYEENSPTTGFTDNDYSSHQATLSLTQNLFNGFDTTNAEKQAQARISSELNRIYDDADNIALEAVKAYLEALKQRKVTKLAEDNVASHEEILRKISERGGHGVGRRSDEEQTKARLAQAHAGLIAQQNNLQDALTRLHTILGRYVLPEELEETAELAMPMEALDDLLAEALANHPAMKSANFNIEAAEYNYARGDSKFMPKIDLRLAKRVGEDIDGYDGTTDEHSAVLNLSYNLYNGGADSAVKQKRLSGVYEHREYATKVHRQILENLRLAWMANQSLAKQLVHLNEYVEKAEKTLDLYIQEFYVGQRDLSHILDAESELNGAKVSLAKASYDAITSAYRTHEGKGTLFNAMGVDVEMTDSDVRLVALNASQLDSTPYNTDYDKDQMHDFVDHCDNSAAGSAIGKYGCSYSVNTQFGYEKAVYTRVEHLNFVFDSAELTEISRDKLAEVIGELKESASGAYIEVHAHTDSLGSQSYNLKLSQRRANKVKEELVAAGFDTRKVIAIGRGEYEPVADNDTDEGRAMNRRVEFHIQRAGF